MNAGDTAVVGGGHSLAKFLAAPPPTPVIVGFGWRAGFLDPARDTYREIP